MQHSEASLVTNADQTECSTSSEPIQPSGTYRGGRVTGYRPSNSRTGVGKSRQQDIANLDGLDIDLAESIVPTSSSLRGGDLGRHRHATITRKVNLTHLLNNKFERPQRGGRYKPPSPHSDSHGSSHIRHVNSQYRATGSLAHKFSKQQFLQANCQFVALDGHDYSVHKADPDWPVDWEYIEEIGFKHTASTQTTCPICLEPPIAAKITRCGHIYCWTCMLHYLSLSDEKCRQCPICFEFVYEKDLRSVVSRIYPNHSVEDEIELRLMIRKKGCVEVEPYCSYPHSLPEEAETDSIDHYHSRANLVIVDPMTVINKIAQRERDELLVKYAMDRDEPEVCFIEQAIERLQARVEQLHKKSSIDTRARVRNQTNISSTSDTGSAKTYLFYQCIDGQHIYLNPFSTKILCHEYKNLENCPGKIKAKILQMDWLSMNETWRRRFRYLEHLPLTCEFRLVEVDFDSSNLISKDTYEVFREEIKSREQHRQMRRKEERKREKIIQVEQNRTIYGIQPALKINLDSIDQFPSVSDERYLGISRTKFNSRTSEESSDEESSDSQNRDIPATAQIEQIQSIGMNTDSKEESVEKPSVEPDLVLSFKDIQIQEAELASRAEKQASGAKKVWHNQPSSSSKQSSFAQLLVDAKTSSKEWTKTQGPSASQRVPSKSDDCVRLTNSFSLGDSDLGDEELRAPPFEFNMSDFIDLSASTAKKKGRLKKR